MVGGGKSEGWKNSSALMASYESMTWESFERQVTDLHTTPCKDGFERWNARPGQLPTAHPKLDGGKNDGAAL